MRRFRVGSGQTGRTTAQFSTALGTRYFDLEKYHGIQGAKFVAQSHRFAIDLARRIVAEEAIDCDCKFVDGFLFRASESEKDTLSKELEACHRIGMREITLIKGLDSHPLLKEECEALCFPQQMQLDPIRYLNGLARAFEKRGGSIYTNSPVELLIGGSTAHVQTKKGHVIRCSSVVVATNSPINDIFAIHTKQAPYRTYVIGVEVPQGSIPPALYWDTSDPYHYVRLAENNLVIVGGEDHKTGQEDDPEQRYEHLEKWAREKIPNALDVKFRWSGQVMEPIDGLGFLGHNPLDRNNVYIITGDAGNGMTHGTIGASLITDQIQGRHNPWETLYSPARKSVRAGFEFLKENVNVAAQYADWLTPKEAKDVQQIPNGQGALIRHGISIKAIYKDEHGTVSECSAVCPHLGGIVHWNSAEKSWDCPCHGSRFDAYGKVIEGPTTSDLPKLSS